MSSDLMDVAVDLVARTLDVEFAKVLQLMPGGDSLLLRAGVGWRDGYVGRATVGTGLDSQAATPWPQGPQSSWRTSPTKPASGGRLC